MTNFAVIDTGNGQLLSGFEGFLARVLEETDINAVLVPKRKGNGAAIMPVLVTDPGQLSGADPFSPSFALNAARQVSRLTRKASGKKIAAVLRPCEIRALVELSKLKQADLTDLVLISVDCLGAYSNKTWNERVNSTGYEDPAQFIARQMESKDAPVASACAICDEFISPLADIRIGLFGMDVKGRLLIESGSEKGRAMLDTLSLGVFDEPASRKESIRTFLEKQRETRAQVLKDTAEKTDSLDKLDLYFERCVNCYNCRVACPVCYCKECVFNTDVFDHDPYQYVSWAQSKGAVKLPVDTLFFHITRLAHMSLSCVGCGQCSNACPNDIPVMELFALVAGDSQAAFNYRAGADPNQALPLSEFKENELSDVVGI